MIYKRGGGGRWCFCFLVPINSSSPPQVVLCVWSLIFQGGFIESLVFIKKLPPLSSALVLLLVCCCSLLELQQHNVPFFFRGTKNKQEVVLSLRKTRTSRETNTHTDAHAQMQTHTQLCKETHTPTHKQSQAAAQSFSLNKRTHTFLKTPWGSWV